jgi:hypothetical protein
LDEDGTNDIKAIPIEWNAAHAVGHLAILQTTAEFWSTPSPSTWDDPAPALWDSAIGPVYIDLI